MCVYSVSNVLQFCVCVGVERAKKGRVGKRENKIETNFFLIYGLNHFRIDLLLFFFTSSPRSTS